MVLAAGDTRHRTRQDDKSRNVPAVPGKHEKEDVGSTKVNSTLRIFKISVKA